MQISEPLYLFFTHENLKFYICVLYIEKEHIFLQLIYNVLTESNFNIIYGDQARLLTGERWKRER